MAASKLSVVQGGRFEAGDLVWVRTPTKGRIPAVVVCASFSTHVFRGSVSVHLQNGELALVGEEELERRKG